MVGNHGGLTFRGISRSRHSSIIAKHPVRASAWQPCAFVYPHRTRRTHAAQAGGWGTNTDRPPPTFAPKGHVYLALTVEIPLNFIRVAAAAIVLVCCSFSAQFGSPKYFIAHARVHSFHAICRAFFFFRDMSEQHSALHPLESVALHLARTLLWADASHFNNTRPSIFLSSIST